MLNRKLAPPYQSTDSLELPKPVEIELRSGAKFFLLPDIQQDVTKLEVVFGAGKWFEPKIGLSHFTSNLLEKGTKHHDAKAIASKLEYYGANLDVQPGYDFVSVAIYSLKSQWRNVLPLFLEILQEPIFPEDEWSLTKDVFLQNLKINNEKTSYRASAHIRKSVFGDQSPYGTSVEEQHVQELNPVDFRNYFKAAFKVHSVYGIGRFDNSELAELQSGLTGIPYAGPLKFTTATDVIKSNVFYEEKEGSVQSSIRMGKRSLLKTDHDYVPFLLVNQVLGGYFGSRLMKNIREEKGLTYGIYSTHHAFAGEGFFSIGADVNKANLQEATREIRSEVKRLLSEPVPEQELILARNHFIGSLQADMANLFAVSDKVKNIQLFGLPKDYYPQLLTRLERTNPSHLLEIANKYLKEDSLFEVAVG